MSSGLDDAPWLEVAWRELGVAERAGAASEPRVLSYYRDAGHGEVTDDGVPWCAAFVAACLKRAGAAATGSLMARSYVTAGRGLTGPRLGAIAVLTRGDDPSAGHVGFVVGWSPASVILLGGNQGDAVSIAAFDRGRIITVRWPDAAGDPPRDVPVAPPPPALPASAGAAPVAEHDGGGLARTCSFPVALRHVLAMEGGYTDDRFDPGGPTNFGITLSDYAAWLRQDLNADTHDRLRTALKSIDQQTVEDIYRVRYWQPSRADVLPAALGPMHFDAAVNHGVGGACRLLQSALGVAVDGEIGPLTTAAAATCDIEQTIERYAERRRERYRALPHFWRFGRGWLSRVDATLAAAKRAHTQSQSTDFTANPTPEASMTRTPISPTTEPPHETGSDTVPMPAKWWGHSMTIWGAAITAAATVLPALAPVLRPVIGIDLTPDIVRQTTADVVQITQALAGVAGTVMTIAGRLRAASRLESRALTVRI